jgi:hypothetical protein
MPISHALSRTRPQGRSKTSPPGLRHLLSIAIVSTAFSAVGVSEDLDLIGWQSKLRFHAVKAYSAEALAESAVYTGFVQAGNAPAEWGQGGVGFSKRLGATLAYSGIRNTLAFGLDTALHQDPRYYRSSETGTWVRMKHAVRGTILTRTDSGAETLSTWRLGSAYGAAFLSNKWCPDRVNTVMLGLSQGTTQLGFDLLGNMASEFWPDVKKKILHGKRHPPQESTILGHMTADGRPQDRTAVQAIGESGR